LIQMPQGFDVKVKADGSWSTLFSNGNYIEENVSGDVHKIVFENGAQTIQFRNGDLVAEDATGKVFVRHDAPANSPQPIPAETIPGVKPIVERPVVVPPNFALGLPSGQPTGGKRSPIAPPAPVLVPAVNARNPIASLVPPIIPKVAATNPFALPPRMVPIAKPAPPLAIVPEIRDLRDLHTGARRIRDDDWNYGKYGDVVLDTAVGGKSLPGGWINSLYDT
jgi:hypothetical protein